MVQKIQLKTLIEILNLHGFTPDNPARASTYQQLIYSYEIPEEITCSYQKDNGVLCGKPHKNGAIIALRDGSLSNVGSCCAKNYFSDGKECLSNDYRLLENRLRRERKHQGLVKLLDNKESTIPRIDSFLANVKGQRHRIKSFGECIGPEAIRQLQSRAKESRPQVNVLAETIKRWRDTRGIERTKKTKVPFPIGNIKNIGIFNPAYAQTLIVDLLNVKDAYSMGEALLDGNIKGKGLFDMTVTRLNSIPGLETKAATYIEQVDGFFDAGLHPILYLAFEPSERYKIGRTLLQYSGNNVGKDKAKIWVREMDKRIKERAKCDNLTLIA